MNVLKSLGKKCRKSSLVKCHRELSLLTKSQGTAVAAPGISCAPGKREIHRDQPANDGAIETKLKSTDKNPFGVYQASGAVVRLPDSYFYMKVSESSRNFDCKPPGTHLESGAIKKKPAATRLGRLRAFALVVTLIYCGGQLSSLAARMLHEFEIFSLPDDDDD